MPATWADEERRGFFLQLVRLALRRDEIDLAADRIAQVEMSLNIVVPARRVRVLEVGHEHAGARIERVDDHLALDRAGDLHPAILDVVGNGRADPARFADASRLVKKVRQLSGVECPLARRAAREQLLAAAAECTLEPSHESDRVRGQDFGVIGGDAAGDVDPRAVDGRAHLFLAIEHCRIHGAEQYFQASGTP